MINYSCSNCGVPINLGQTYCDSCGIKLAWGKQGRSQLKEEKKTPMTLENKWDIIYVSLVIIGLIGLALLWNSIFIGFFMSLFLPLIIWIHRGDGFRITYDRTLDRLKNFKKYQTKTIYTAVLLFILFVFIIKASIPFISFGIENYQHNRVLKIQAAQNRVKRIEKENTPQINIQMITDLNGIVKGTGITLEYVVDNASGVYFNGNLVSPSSGTNYFKQEVELYTPRITVDIKGENRYWNNAKSFVISREKTEQEIQEEKVAEQVRIQEEKDAEKARIAEEKYKNSPAYKTQLLQGIADKLNNDVNGLALFLRIQCQDFIKLSLVSPSSADFPGSYKGWGGFIVQGNKIVDDSYVDAQNSFGAQLRMYFECIYELDGEDINLVDVKEL